MEKHEEIRVSRGYFQGLNGPRMVWHEIEYKQGKEMTVPGLLLDVR